MLDLESLPSITCRTTRPVVIDPTADQFGTPGFLTLQPSKRAQALLAAAGLTSA
jgi:hypothetical protein